MLNFVAGALSVLAVQLLTLGLCSLWMRWLDREFSVFDENDVPRGTAPVRCGYVNQLMLAAALVGLVLVVWRCC